MGRGCSLAAALFVLLILANIVIDLGLSPPGEPAHRILSGLISGTVVAPFLALVVRSGHFRLGDAHRTCPGQVTPSSRPR
jgi:hypothetical protein